MSNRWRIDEDVSIGHYKFHRADYNETRTQKEKESDGMVSAALDEIKLKQEVKNLSIFFFWSNFFESG